MSPLMDSIADRNACSTIRKVLHSRIRSQTRMSSPPYRSRIAPSLHSLQPAFAFSVAQPLNRIHAPDVGGRRARAVREDFLAPAAIPVSSLRRRLFGSGECQLRRVADETR